MIVFLFGLQIVLKWDKSVEKLDTESQSYLFFVVSAIILKKPFFIMLP